MTESPQRPPSLAEVVAAVHRRYDPSTAESWDAVGLVCGDPAQSVCRVHFAVDAVEATVDEALAAGADLLITHHPLLLTPVSSVAATTPAGGLIHRLIGGGCALLAVHTNADLALDGVSDTLAEALGLGGVRALIPSDIPGPAGTGLGRVGELATAMNLGDFAALVHRSLPLTAAGLRIAGDLERPVRRVAVCGGSGAGALSAAAAAGVDVMVTADLKHHNAGDHMAAGGPALVDVAHWASEWPWLQRAADLLVTDLGADGVTVDTYVSRIVTDPWTARL